MAAANRGAQILEKKAARLGSIRKLAREIGFDRAAVYRWIKDGVLPSYRGRIAATKAGANLGDWERKPRANRKRPAVIESATV
jgi:hypothetical protein